jgi:hypothetical protein
MAVPTRPDYDHVIDEDWGQWVHDALANTGQPNGGAAGGIIAYATTSTDQMGIASATYVDVVGTSLTFTAVAGRRYRFRLGMALYSDAGNNDGWQLLKDGAVHRIFVGVCCGAGVLTSAYATWGQADCLDTPTAGSHTYKWQVRRAAGTGNINIQNSSCPLQVWVEDVGPV